MVQLSGKIGATLERKREVEKDERRPKREKEKVKRKKSNNIYIYIDLRYSTQLKFSARN